MSLMRPLPPLRPVVVLALLACNGDPFTAPARCLSDCPLPLTKPPVVHFITPAPGELVTPNTTLYASATDDRRVTGVEFFHSWVKIHPGVIGAPPYRMILGKYPTGLPAFPGTIALEVVAYDIEGNADTEKVVVPYSP